MMSFNRQFREAFRAVFPEEKFQYTSKGQYRYFYRPINDVVQIFSLVAYRGGSYDCTFVIAPMSGGLWDLYGEYDLSVHAVPCRGDWERQELIDTNFQEPVSIAKELVVPIFNSGIDAGTAYREQVAFEKYHFMARVLRSSSVYREMSLYEQYQSMATSVRNPKAFMLLCLQAGDYRRAAEYLEIILARIGDINEKVSEANSQAKIDRLKKKKLHYEYQLQKIREQDTEYWGRELETGTQKTLRYLESLQVKGRKKGET